MSSYSGPKITTNGLLVSYDAANNKSFRGQATTNIISNGEFASELNNWNPYALPLASLSVITSSDVPQYLNEDKTILNCLCLTTAHGGGNYGGAYQFLPTQTAGVTYTISYYARCLVDTMGLKFSFQGGAGDENNLSHSRTITTEWKKYSHTATLNISKGIVFIANQNRSGGTFQITDIQLEASPYASSFVNGTRGTTLATGGGLADLSGNDYNAELLNGIGESSDNLGGLILDGSNDQIDGPFVAPNIGNFTYEMVAKWNVFDGLNDNDIFAAGTGSGLSGGTYIRCQLAATGIQLNLYAPQTLGGGWKEGDYVAGSFSANTIYHITIVNTGTIWRFYSNGVLLGSYDHNYLSNTGSTRFAIFRDHVQVINSQNSGVVYLCNIYNRALTSQEVQQNFNSIRGRFGI